MGNSPRPDASPPPISAIGSVGAAILDLRADRAAFAARHLQGSLFAPLPGGKLPIAAGSYVDENASILLVVEDESQVDEAVRQLIRIGLDRVEAWIPAAEALADSRFTSRLRPDRAFGTSDRRHRARCARRG